MLMVLENLIYGWLKVFANDKMNLLRALAISHHTI